MSDIGDLYQEVILDHYKSPRNFGALPGATGAAKGENPLCGDKVDVFVKMRGGAIGEIRFEGNGCALSTAAASLMTEGVKGMSRRQVEEIFDRFHLMVTGRGGGEGLGKLEAFAGVSEFPIRVKCAMLAWHVLRAAMDGSKELVTLE